MIKKCFRGKLKKTTRFFETSFFHVNVCNVANVFLKQAFQNMLAIVSDDYSLETVAVCSCLYFMPCLYFMLKQSRVILLVEGIGHHHTN
jgi:hypothetical protein